VPRDRGPQAKAALIALWTSVSPWGALDLPQLLDHRAPKDFMGKETRVYDGGAKIGPIAYTAPERIVIRHSPESHRLCNVLAKPKTIESVVRKWPRDLALIRLSLCRQLRNKRAGTALGYRKALKQQSLIDSDYRVARNAEERLGGSGRGQLGPRRKASVGDCRFELTV
jgi:hypothetical protein